MSRPIQPSGTSTPSSSRRWASAAKRSAITRSTRQLEAGSRRSARSSARRARLDALLLAQRVADLVALRAEEGKAHGAADQDGVGRLEEALDDADLVRHLRAADHGDERAPGSSSMRERLHLASQEAARGGRPQMRHALGAGVSAVRGAEGVVDVDVGQRGRPRASASSLSVSPGRSARSRASRRRRAGLSARPRPRARPRPGPA